MPIGNSTAGQPERRKHGEGPAVFCRRVLKSDYFAFSFFNERNDLRTCEVSCRIVIGIVPMILHLGELSRKFSYLRWELSYGGALALAFSIPMILGPIGLEPPEFNPAAAIGVD